MDLSICILTLNARGYLEGCLRSIVAHTRGLTYEILVADNGSSDDTLELLASDFPQVKVMPMGSNLGFTKPVNHMLRAAVGDFLLVLNPDTYLEEDCFGPQLQFLRTHEDVGISIPKVLNADGTLQRQSRRGEGRMIEALGYHLKLNKLFPKHKGLNGYLMPWLGEDEIGEVKAVSGSCMFISRRCWEAVGDFDEKIFAYQEDSDYCLRARKLGWKVMYVPISRITHFGGQGGSGAQPARTIREWHRSYFYYYRKHFAKDTFFLVNWLFYLMMGGRYLLASASNLLKRK